MFESTRRPTPTNEAHLLMGTPVEVAASDLRSNYYNIWSGTVGMLPLLSKSPTRIRHLRPVLSLDDYHAWQRETKNTAVEAPEHLFSTTELSVHADCVQRWNDALLLVQQSWKLWGIFPYGTQTSITETPIEMLLREMFEVAAEAENLIRGTQTLTLERQEAVLEELQLNLLTNCIGRRIEDVPTMYYS